MRRNPLSNKTFSMLELIVVLVLLTTLTAIIAPRLSGFFGGRGLDDEARRLWAAAERSRQEAINQGLTVSLVYDAEAYAYQIEPGPGPQAIAVPAPFPLAAELEIVDADDPGQAPGGISWRADGTVPIDAMPAWLLRDTRRPDDAWRLAYDSDAAAYRLSREARP